MPFDRLARIARTNRVGFSAINLRFGLLAFYHFDGNLTDSSGRGKNLSGSVTYTTGFRNQGLAFGTATRADAYGQTAAPASMSFWVFPDSQDQGVLGFTDGLGTILFGFDISGQAFSVIGDGAIATQANVPELDWHHIVLTRDVSAASFYLDGTLFWSGSLPIATPFTDFEVSSVGTLPNVIDDLGVWSRALRSAESGALYSGGTGKDPTA